MADILKNIKFEYLYRDAGNYKQYGSIVLKNPTSLDSRKVTDLIKPHLIDGEFFDPETFNVPRLEVNDYDPELDHDWYEFEKISETDESATNNRTIINFISEIKKMKSLSLRQGLSACLNPKWLCASGGE